jgi:hypothetical protein
VSKSNNHDAVWLGAKYGWPSLQDARDHVAATQRPCGLISERHNLPPSQEVRQQISMFAIAAALFLAMTGSAAAGAGDYELTIRWPTEELHVPAKSLADCEAATMGKWQPLNMPPIHDAVELSCKPHPGYFSDSSNHIEGFNR